MSATPSTNGDGRQRIVSVDNAIDNDREEPWGQQGFEKKVYSQLYIYPYFRYNPFLDG